MSYTITSGYSILAGSCDIDGTTVSNYNSTNNGLLTVTPMPAEREWNLHFKVTYNPPPPAGGGKPAAPQVYVIKANLSGKNYSGHAKHGSKKTDESWAAAASGVEPAVSAKGNKY